MLIINSVENKRPLRNKMLIKLVIYANPNPHMGTGIVLLQNLIYM